MSQVVDDLVAQVAAQKTVVDSAHALLSRLFALLQGAVDTGDVSKISQALAELKAQDGELARAVSDNTPAAEPQAQKP